MTQLAKQRIEPGPLGTEFSSLRNQARRTDLVGEILRKNANVFGKREKTHLKVILNRLGWIDAVREMPANLPEIEDFAQNVRRTGARHLLVLGMGGSSLCPEVFGRVFGARSWLKSYSILDTTAPSAIEAVLRQIDLRKAFFIVSSKSGTTVETLSQYRFFFQKLRNLRPLKAGQSFAAITDQGSALHRVARRNRFQKIFLNRSDIGGRYSALSFFGLVPGAFTRADLGEIMRQAAEFLDRMEHSGTDNEALDLGALIAGGAKAGRDKLSFSASPSLAPFVPWIEQLVAESTGKEKKGIIPIEGESDREPSGRSDDRVMICYRLKDERSGDPSRVGDMPAAIIELDDPHLLGAEMLKWEMATAVAAALLGVNPFDEPNVAESKKNTSAILETRARRKPPAPAPLNDLECFTISSVSNVAGIKSANLSGPREILHRLLDGVGKGEYLSILCYTEMTPEIEEKLAGLRLAIEKRNGAAVLRGYGPRFLHSIGQLYKGGSPKGHFLVLEREYPADYDIPRMNITFGQLIRAQAEGDVKALHKRKRPLVQINLRQNPAAALEKLTALVAGG